MEAIEDLPCLNVSHEVVETILPMALEELADSKDSVIPEVEREYNATVHATTRSGRRQISSSLNIELQCGCGGCDQTKMYSMISLKKCRQCNIHVLITHLSSAWTCQQCYDDNEENGSEDDD